MPAPGPQSAPLTGGEQAIVTKIKPGLVIINTTVQYNSEAAAGTGMVINANGLVLTNNHVIDRATKITATAASTGTTYSATVVGYDKTDDIALIQLQNASGLTAISIGYPPFAGIFTGSGSNSSPQAQAQQHSGGFSGGIGNTPRCYTNNSGLYCAVGHRAGQLRRPDHRDYLREPGSRGRHNQRIGHHGGERAGRRLTR